jgi:hypothetical protein
MRATGILAFVIGSLAASATAAYAADTASKAPAADNQPAPVIMMVPVEISAPALKNGCWAQLYDERNFKGDVFTVVGPMQLVSTDNSAGRQLKRNIDSLVVGPRATLTVYERSMFKDKAVTFGPNSKEPGLIKKLGFTGRIESLKLDCAG